MDITTKSTGFLIDELITARFKVEVSPTHDNIQRVRLLDAATRLRLNGREDDIYLQVVKLQVILRQCWEAQEVVMNACKNRNPDYTLIGKAGIKAQETNAQRNKLIREIDTILGEDSITPLGKTYG